MSSTMLLAAALRIVTALGVALLTGEAAVRIASSFLPGVRYLSTVRVKSRPQHFPNLEAFRTAQATHLVPFRNWHNYFNNSLGFNDAEFESPKNPERHRILALGDSFCFSSAPYPDAIQTLVEQQLGQRCGRDIDLLNAGIAATGPWEYRALLELSLPVWQPDTVVLHFYLGNDGPDLFLHQNDLPFREAPALHSSFLTYVRNAVKLLRSREASPPVPRRGNRSRAVGKGGEIVDPALPPATDLDPAISGPVFSAEAFLKIMADEFGRLYVPEEGVERDWEPIVGVLDEMRRTAVSSGVRFLIVLYPSRLQVYPEFRRDMLAAVTAQGGYRGLAGARIDPMAPNRYLLAWCARSGVDCFDLTPFLSRSALLQTRPLYVERDSHWNILGNRLAAAGEAAFLERALCPAGIGGRAPGPK